MRRRHPADPLRRVIVTAYVAKHRVFAFVDAAVAPDEKLVVIASASAFVLGCLSSRIHVEWALAAGGSLGGTGTPCYNNSLCFASFPFPDPRTGLRARIAGVALRLERHRTAARRHGITLTGMYDVLEKMRVGAELSAAERRAHEAADCGTLFALHGDLDRRVAEGYDWPWPMDRDEILDRLVKLHGERRAEEASGRVRWVRPEYQAARAKSPPSPG